MNTETPLVPGRSTVADAAARYGMTPTEVVALLAEGLTDVFVPVGDAGVIDSVGRDLVTVNGGGVRGTCRKPALVLGADSIALLEEVAMLEAAEREAEQGTK